MQGNNDLNQKFKSWINIHIEVKAWYLSKSQKGKKEKEKKDNSLEFLLFVKKLKKRKKEKVSSAFSFNSLVKKFNSS